ncbi:hypothetical protein ACFL23_02030 [Patescibacteria group bacterium]
MTTEQRVFKQIAEHQGKASAQLIAKQLSMGNAYVEYLCMELFEKGLVKKLKRRDWYQITRKGWKALGRIGELRKPVSPSPRLDFGVEPRRKGGEESKEVIKQKIKKSGKYLEDYRGEGERIGQEAVQLPVEQIEEQKSKNIKEKKVQIDSVNEKIISIKVSKKAQKSALGDRDSKTKLLGKQLKKMTKFFKKFYSVMKKPKN